VSNTSDWLAATARAVTVRKYYYLAGQRVAMRRNGVVQYLHGDHPSLCSGQVWAARR